MKRIFAFIFTLTLILTTLASCIPNTPKDTRIRIGYMAGPTGMGMAKLISDNGGLENGNDKYTFTKYTDTNTAMADLSAGRIDIICLPTNEAATYYNNPETPSSKVLAINCLNSLYLLTDSNTTAPTLLDLEGQTIYTCKNGTPRMVLEYIIKKAQLDINVSYEHNGKEIVSPDDLSKLVVSGELPIVVMPEPKVTAALLAIKQNGNPEIEYSVDINLSKVWKENTPIAMGCILASDKVITENKAGVDAFLAEYKTSIEYIGNPENIESAANYIVETGVMGAAPAAKKALANLSGAITYIDGADMKSTLVAFYNAIGITLPADAFYYEK